MERPVKVSQIQLVDGVQIFCDPAELLSAVCY